MVMAVLMENFVLLLLLPSFSNKACLNRRMAMLHV